MLPFSLNFKLFLEYQQTFYSNKIPQDSVLINLLRNQLSFISRAKKALRNNLNIYPQEHLTKPDVNISDILLMCI